MAAIHLRYLNKSACSTDDGIDTKMVIYVKCGIDEFLRTNDLNQLKQLLLKEYSHWDLLGFGQNCITFLARYLNSSNMELLLEHQKKNV